MLCCITRIRSSEVMVSKFSTIRKWIRTVVHDCISTNQNFKSAPFYTATYPFLLTWLDVRDRDVFNKCSVKQNRTFK